MGETTEQGTGGKSRCWCMALVGALVIVLAWWKVRWGSIGLTVLGVVIILKEVVSRCCCPNTDQSKHC